ncbi:hypothetical protein ACHAXA_009170 [Cyclostephanos tholiformis]|uniref:MBD domain-containing protein n=1 Tax=Cyclostephanos tholiformis TaxID=382380 RepID=A0ABD3RR48_9STRA
MSSESIDYIVANDDVGETPQEVEGGGRWSSSPPAVAASASVVNDDDDDDDARRNDDGTTPDDRAGACLDVAPTSAASDDRGESRPTSAAPVGVATRAPPKTPGELYARIEGSRDRLFFIAYNADDDDDDHDGIDDYDNNSSRGGGKEKKKDEKMRKDDNKNNKKKKMTKKKGKKSWSLVRVDLDQCLDPELQLDCQSTGQYYVEFYAKASRDRGILLPVHKHRDDDDDDDAASKKSKKMRRPKPDSESRYWIEWHEFHYDKKGKHHVGRWREIPPNSEEAMLRRFEIFRDKLIGEDDDDDGGGGGGGADIVSPEFHPDYAKYLAQATILNLMDDETRLVGPFDFDDSVTKAPPCHERYVAKYDDESREIFLANYTNLYVRDRVPLSRWMELLDAIRDRQIDPPVVGYEKNDKTGDVAKRRASVKRARDVMRGPMASSQTSKGKRARDGPKERPYQELGKDGTLLTFPATASRPKLQLPLSDGWKSHGRMIVSRERMKEGMSSVIEAAFARIRQATSEDGKVYHVLDELKESLNEEIDSFVVADLSAASTSPAIERGEIPSGPLEGLPTSDFAEEEVDSFPVVFAFDNEDPDGISEENARIATLDHEVKQRQLKRSGVDLSEEMKKAKSTKKRSDKEHPTLTEKERQLPAKPAEGFPAGWVVRQKPREKTVEGGPRVDTFWYSPEKNFRFRSKPEVRRFLEALKTSDGDETVAIELVK